MVLLLIVVLLCFKSVKENLRIKNNKLFPDERGNLHCCPIFHQNYDKAHRQAGLYFSFIYLFLYGSLLQLMRRCAPLRHIVRLNPS